MGLYNRRVPNKGPSKKPTSYFAVASLNRAWRIVETSLVESPFLGSFEADLMLCSLSSRGALWSGAVLDNDLRFASSNRCKSGQIPI